MKYIFTAILGLGLLTSLHSQVNLHSPQIVIGYLGQVGIHPGVEAGGQIPLKELDFSSNPAVTHNLVLTPKAGIFFRGKRERSVWLHADLGILRKKVEKSFTSILGAGVGYLGQSTQMSETVNLGSGEITGDDRDWTHYAIPTLNYEVGSKLGIATRWYTKLSVGPKLGGEELEMALFLEAGIKLAWPNK